MADDAVADAAAVAAACIHILFINSSNEMFIAK